MLRLHFPYLNVNKTGVCVCRRNFQWTQLPIADKHIGFIYIFYFSYFSCCCLQFSSKFHIRQSWSYECAAYVIRHTYIIRLHFNNRCAKPLSIYEFAFKKQNLKATWKTFFLLWNANDNFAVFYWVFIHALRPFEIVLLK